jgi:hypothetical protein
VLSVETICITEVTGITLYPWQPPYITTSEEDAMTTTINKKALPISELPLGSLIGSDLSHVLISRQILTEPHLLPHLLYRDGELIETVSATTYVVIGFASNRFDPYVVWNVLVDGDKINAYTGFYTNILASAVEEYERRISKGKK